MNPSHYPSLELCKKLTEIGFPETERDWLNDWWYEHGSERYAWISKDTDIKDEWVRLRCPSIMEMIDIMPDSIHDKIWQKKWLEIGKKFVAYSTNWMAVHMVDWPIPNALAEMMLWLHENNYIYLPK